MKLLLKEYVAPTQANIALFFLGPVITLIFGLLGYCALPKIIIGGLTITEITTVNFYLFELTVAFIYIISIVIHNLYLLLHLELVALLLEIINIIHTVEAAPECIAAFATPMCNMSVIFFILPYIKGNREIISLGNRQNSTGKFGAYANKVTQAIRVCEMRKALYHKRAKLEKKNV
jgi:hypothetical protein